MKTTLASILFLLAAATTSVFAQNQDFTKLNQFLDSLGKHDMFMGTVLMATDGEPVFVTALGYSNFEGKNKAKLS